MFEIYLTQAAQDAMTRDDAYLLTQTMRVFNVLRLFITIADDLRRNGPDDIVNQKKFIELLLYHGANLYEVLITLRDDLFERYRASLRLEANRAGLSRWEQRLKDNDETIRVLAAIRNKHSFHIGHDPYYPWKYITEGPATADKLIGVGETMQGLGWFFTWDIDIILAYIRDHALEQQGPVEDDYLKVKHIIDAASVDLYTLFQRIVSEMVDAKIYMKGEKQEARRDYRDPGTGEGT